MDRVLEQTAGVGEVFENGKRVGRARYSITVYQHADTVGGNGSSDEDVKKVMGIVRPEAPLTATELMLRDTPLTLRLKDGRWWAFAFTTCDGRAINTGRDLYRE